MMDNPNRAPCHLRWQVIAATLVIVTAIWAARVVALDRVVTVDESRWAFRAANFVSALDQQDFASTFQKEHPGVTTMWAGSAGLLWRFSDYGLGNPGQVSVHEYLGILNEHGHTILQLITAGRFFMVLANTIVLGLAFIFAQRLLGLVASFFGFLLIAFDPFHIALTRVLHLDGLLSSLLLLSLLAYLSFGQKRHLAALITSGVAAGLSWLTKSPGLFLIPIMVLLSVLDALYDWFQRRVVRLGTRVWQFVWPLILWGIVAVVVFVVLWPAMWVDPLGTLSDVLSPALGHAAEGHSLPIFFNGQIFANGQVNTATFYPISFLWRSTPIVLAGILIAVLAFFLKREPLNDPKTRRATLGLVVFVVAYAALQNMGTKKFDRYLLPVFLPLDLIAAVGWVTLARWLRSKWSTPMMRSTATLLLVVLVSVQAIGTFRTFPYYLSYYNPLMGGSRKAPEVMMIGWGEGLDQAARYLNEKPNAQNLKVLTWFTQSFDPYFEGTTEFIVKHEGINAQLEEMRYWHYAVIYINQWQRQMPGPILDHLAQQAPEHSIWVNGMEYAQIYKLRSVPEPPEPSVRIAEGNLGNLARLEGFDLPSPLLTTPESTLPLTLTWQATGVIKHNYTVFVHLVGDDNQPLAQIDGQPLDGRHPTSSWDVGQRIGDPYQLTIPSDLPPGEYNLLVGMYLLSTGERLPLLGTNGQVLGDSVPLGPVTVSQP